MNFLRQFRRAVVSAPQTHNQLTDTEERQKFPLNENRSHQKVSVEARVTSLCMQKNKEEKD